MYDEAGPSGRRLEHLRHWATWSLIGLSLVSFVLGPLGFILAAWFMGSMFAFGFELSRPVSQTRRVDRRWTILVRLLLLSYIPLAFLVIFIDTQMETVTGSFEADLPWHYMLVLASLYWTAAGALIAIIHILRKRGPPGALKFHLKTLPVLAVGLLFSLILPVGPVWYLGPLLVFFPAIGLAGHALLRIIRPVRRVETSVEVTVMPESPTFTPFGRRP